jgi:hypothetical protein
LSITLLAIGTTFAKVKHKISFFVELFDELRTTGCGSHIHLHKKNLVGSAAQDFHLSEDASNLSVKI